jgi:glucose-1-phosphate thymidylyltransferase
MEIARAVVLAAPSAQDRPWSSIGTGPKPLIPIATKPIVFHALEALRRAGVLEVALLTEPHTAELYEAAIGDGRRWDMEVRYEACALDTDMHGALRVTSDFIDGEPVLVQRADALIREQLREHIVNFAHDNLDAIALMVANGPVTPESLPRMAGGYLLSPRAVAVIRDGGGAHDPVARLRHNGSEVRVFDVEGYLACHGSESSLLDANRHALGAITTDTGSVELEGSEIQGPVRIHPTAMLRNTLVRGPAVIGPRTRLVDSYVGPYSSIGADVRIEGTEIEHSIVMDAAQLLFVGSRLETSIIGRGASIVRRFDMPSAVRMSIGDGAQVALS